MIKLGGRSFSRIFSAAFKPEHYVAISGMWKNYPHFLEGLYRYLSVQGTYPVRFEVRTPLGLLSPTLYSSDDFRTLNEIFCREDYSVPSSIRTVVDFGSNIGLSALYFLSRNTDAIAYLFEPLSSNVERLTSNLAGFESRYRLDPVAVGVEDGEVEFGYEPTGRYGGIGLPFPQTCRVPCKSAVRVIESVLEERGHIDALKIDIEALEQDVLLSLEPHQLSLIEMIFIEQRFDSNLLGPMFDFRQYGGVAQFRKRDLETVGAS
jgi:FkbM family methyltransferase